MAGLIWSFTVDTDTLSRRVGYYVMLSIITEVIVWSGFKFALVSNNLPLLHAFTVLEFGLFLWCFASVFRFLTNRVLMIGVGVFAGLELFLGQDLQPFLQYNTIMRSLEAVVMIGLSIGYFFKTMRGMQVEQLTATAEFWFATALLLYFSGNLVLFGFSNFMNQSPLIQSVWIMHSFLNILLNILLTVSIWKGRLKTS